MTLQEKRDAEESSSRSISVQSKAVRWGNDGVGLEFVLPDTNDRRRGQSLLEDGVDRRTLEKFLEGFKVEHGYAIVRQVADPRDVSFRLGTAKS